MDITEVNKQKENKQHPIQLDAAYKTCLKELKKKVTSTRMQVMLAVNVEQIKLYWEIGRALANLQKVTKWGTKLLEQASKDLRHAFPDMRGFSRTNVHYMKQFAEIYSDIQFVQQPVGQLPWGHIITLIQKVKEHAPRDWYARQAVEQGWARDALTRQIKLKLYERQGQESRKLTNFKRRLPEPASDFAHELIKETYDFGFLPMCKGAKEREVERGLINDVKQFLLELGTGFSFVANQFHLDVDGNDYYIDLLMFNIKLNCYFIIEIKIGKFKPEYTGKLNFYISVVDDRVKESRHAPTIGLLLCEDKNRVVAEYSLNKTLNPMGISEYQLAKSIPKALQNTLPSVELIEDRLSDELTVEPVRHSERVDDSAKK